MTGYYGNDQRYRPAQARDAAFYEATGGLPGAPGSLSGFLEGFMSGGVPIPSITGGHASAESGVGGGGWFGNAGGAFGGGGDFIINRGPSQAVQASWAIVPWVAVGLVAWLALRK